jgi:hypothetical protein
VVFQGDFFDTKGKNVLSTEPSNDEKERVTIAEGGFG